jgi:hypothetical protein
VKDPCKLCGRPFFALCFHVEGFFLFVCIVFFKKKKKRFQLLVFGQSLQTNKRRIETCVCPPICVKRTKMCKLCFLKVFVSQTKKLYSRFA